MMLRLFAVQDLQAGAFHAPFPAQTEGVALRMMRDCVNRAGHPYNLHPADYVLYEIGGFEEDNAELSQSAAPRKVSNLVALVQTSEV